MDYLIFFFILTTIILIIITYIHIKHIDNNVVYIKSDIDNKQYLVRNLDDKQSAANLLASIKRNIFTLTEYLYKNIDKYKDYEKYIRQLNDKIYSADIMESSEDNKYTSYSVNKGEEIIFCLRSKNDKNKLHDMNLIMYVVLHEMAHVACPEYGHTELFKKIFHFITTVAIEIKLYSKIDYKKTPIEYCGLMITDTIV